MLKSLTETTTRYSGFISVALIFLINTAQGHEVKPGPAFALLAGFIYFSNNMISYTSGAFLYLFELLATIKRTEQILQLN